MRAQFSHGTERLVPPEQTLARIAPVLAANGVTRCMPVTQLDDLGVPSFCAVRPRGLVLQVSNGKGLTDAAARVSAAMEAIELTHAERPLDDRLRRTSAETLRREGAAVLDPRVVHGYLDRYYTDAFVCEWVEGRSLIDDTPLWAPASAVYFYREPSLHLTSTNGLASGNDRAEATLHALYELIERDAMTRLGGDGTLRIRERTRVIDPGSIADRTVSDLMTRMEAAGTLVRLLWLPSAIAVHTFWAVIVNRNPLTALSTLNVGWGTHADAAIAACRALTEAAQSRAGLIHGAREDIQLKGVARLEDAFDSEGVRYFMALEPSAAWSDVAAQPGIGTDRDLAVMVARIVGELARAGHDRLIGFDLTNPAFDIPVVKVLAPSLQFNHKLF